MNNPTPLQLRRAESADAAVMARLNAQFNEVYQPAEFYAARLQEAQRVDTPLLAEVGGRVVGLASLRLIRQVFYPGLYAELTELFVEEEYRRCGVGRRLVEFAEQLARAAGATEMLILTNFYNHPALRLYAALGYEHRDLALIKQFPAPEMGA